MSNLALSDVILLLFIFAAGLGLGSLARAQFERNLRREATASRPHRATSVAAKARPAPKRKAPAKIAAGKKPSRSKKRAAPSAKRTRRPRKAGGKT